MASVPVHAPPARPLVLIAGLREKLEFAAVPNMVKGAALTLLLAGILSISFMGFAGLGG